MLRSVSVPSVSYIEACDPFVYYNCVYICLCCSISALHKQKGEVTDRREELGFITMPSQRPRDADQLLEMPLALLLTIGKCEEWAADNNSNHGSVSLRHNWRCLT